MSELKDRYPGLRSFEAKDADLFFGRDDEINVLTRTIISERVTVIFGVSGVGKSSLLNTAFLKSQPLSIYKPVKIRFSSINLKGRRKRSLTPLQTVDRFLKKDIPGIEQVEVMYDKTAPGLWEYVKRAELAVSRKDSRKLVLIFDQFEEYFYYPHEIQEAFNLLLAEIVHELPPTRILRWITSLNTEERNEAVLEWYKQPDIKLIFSIRSDKLSAMNSMVKYIPQILRNRMELRLFKDDNARDAILCPAQLPNNTDNSKFNSPPIMIATEVVDRIIKDLSNAFSEIEAAFLQIVCFTIENQVKAMAKNKVDKFEYGESLFNEQIDIVTILDNYYNASIDKLPEADARLAKKVIEDKLVVDGERTSLLVNQLIKELGPDHARLTSFLLGERLIREENTSKGMTYELSHDKLIGPVERSKTIRNEQEKAELEALEAKKKYDLQKKLIEHERAKIEVYAAKEQAYTAKEQAYMSKVRLRKITFYFTLLSVGLVALSIYFFISSRTMKRDARRYKAEYLLAKAKDAFQNLDNYLGFNFLWAADSLRSTNETDTLLSRGTKQLLLGYDIRQSDDGNYLASTTTDSVLYVWKTDQERLQLLKSFHDVRAFSISEAFNKLAVFRKNNILLWDIEKNVLIDSLPDIISNDEITAGFEFSNYGNTLFFTDTLEKFHLFSIDEKRLQTIRLSGVLDSGVSMANTRISKDGKKLLVKYKEGLHYFDLSDLKAGEKSRIERGRLLLPKNFSDSVFYTLDDSLCMLDLNTGLQQYLFSFKDFFPEARIFPYYQCVGPYILFQQRDKPFRLSLVDLRTKKQVFELLDCRSPLPSSVIKLNQDGFAYQDTAYRVKFASIKTGQVKIIDTLTDFKNISSIERRRFKLRFVQGTTELYYTIDDTVYIRNYNTGAVSTIELKNFGQVLAIDQATILVNFNDENFYYQLLSRSNPTKKQARKRMAFLDRDTKARFGLKK